MPPGSSDASPVRSGEARVVHKFIVRMCEFFVLIFWRYSAQAVEGEKRTFRFGAELTCEDRVTNV